VTPEQARNAIDTFARVAFPAMERGNLITMVEVPGGLSTQTMEHIDRAISEVVNMAVQAERGGNDGPDD
jgi:hypothetical protein